MTMSYNELKALDGISITSAYVKDQHHFAFVGQRFNNSDAWSHSRTYVIFCDVLKQRE